MVPVLHFVKSFAKIFTDSHRDTEAQNRISNEQPLKTPAYTCLLSFVGSRPTKNRVPLLTIIKMISRSSCGVYPDECRDAFPSGIPRDKRDKSVVLRQAHTMHVQENG
jgi:hypothetical protein